FMENVFNASQVKKNFSATDFHAPCGRLAEKYARDCYIMQTSRMAEMGLSPEQIVEECAKAGPHRLSCAQSLGRDLSNDARLGKYRFGAQHCESATQGDMRLACVRGVAYALVDSTWDGSHAMPFCSVLSDIDRDECWKMAIFYMRTVFDQRGEDIARDCARLS